MTLCLVLCVVFWAAPAMAAEENPPSAADADGETSEDQNAAPDENAQQTDESPEAPSNDPDPTLEVNATNAFLIFPVAGRISYIDSWGAPRSGGRTHKGTDIFAEKGTPVVAVAPGVVISAAVSDGTAGVYVKVRHPDGAVSVYLHLNNDSPGTDDGQVVGIANGIAEGTFVPAGMILGYVGDSGNAESTDPHLHFEYRPDGKTAVNPFPSLQTVQGPIQGDTHTSPTTLPYTGLPSSKLGALAMVLILAGWTVLMGERAQEAETRQT